MSNLVISGIIDGPLTGGLPKAIELFALDDIPDLNLYGIGSANNGDGSDGQERLLSGTASAGDYLYVATEAIEFQNFFGFAPTFETSAASINGDDAIELFLNGTVVDVFGDINVDGTGQPWEYMDGWAYRKVNTGPDGNTFNLNNWSFSGVDALDGTTTNATAATPFPLGKFDRNNDAPVLNGDATLTGINEDVAGAANSGTTVTDLLAQVTVADADFDPLGIAVTSADDTNGTWQYSTDGGTTWTPFGTVAANNAVTLGATSLYTGFDNTNQGPDDQGYFAFASVILNTPPTPPTPALTETEQTVGVTVNTTANKDIYAGYSNFVLTPPSTYTAVNPNFPTLDSTAGYTLSFNAQVVSEVVEPGRPRAGFSVIAVSQDPTKSVELAFQDGLIFAQTLQDFGPPLDEQFVASTTDRVTFDTTQEVQYSLAVQGTSYTLSADGAEILTGTLQDYTSGNTNGAPDPYSTSSFVFLGDNTTSARGEFRLNQIALETPTQVRFVPDADYNGDATIDFLAWDTTDGSDNGQTVDASVTGGATAFSTTSSTGTITVTPVNDSPTLTSFAAPVDTTNEDTQVELTFAELAAQGDAADVDSTVTGFVVQAVTSGTLLLGATAATATALVAGTNDTIDGTTNAYWRPEANANGTALDAFTVLAQDDQGATSTPAVTVQVAVTAIGEDIPTVIAGTSGTDNLVGTPGKDNLVGYAGHDILTGGAGKDQFVITDISDRQDTITDFTAGTDVIHLVQLFDKHGITAATYTDAAAQEYLAIVADGAGGSVVRFDPNGNGGFFDFISPVNLLAAQGVAPATLANDAHFVLQ